MTDISVDNYDLHAYDIHEGKIMDVIFDRNTCTVMNHLLSIAVSNYFHIVVDAWLLLPYKTIGQ